MIRIKILKKSFVILSLLLVFSVGSALSYSAHAQLFNSSKKKTTNVYNPIPKNQPSSPKKSDNANDVAPESEAKTKTETKSGSTAQPNSAQTDSLPRLGKTVLGHVQAVTSSCVKKWKGPSCMKVLSAMNMTLVSSYAEALHGANKKSYMEPLKQSCAASTAALKVSVPAYAMRSAMTECVNIMVDISDKTSVLPNPSLSQLAVGAILCMGKDKSCATIEQGLSAAVQRK